MRDLAVQTQSKALSALSDEGFAKAVKILDSEAPVNEWTPLLAAYVCERVLERLDADSRRATPEQAHGFTRLLLGCYPALKAHDPEVYTAAIVAVFCDFPASVGKIVADPVKGLASRLKYDPKPADVVEALTAETKRLELIRANALWHLQEREERVRVKQAEREFAASRPSREARKALADKLLAGAFNQWPDKSEKVERDGG